MREVFFLIGTNDDVLWSDASNSPVRLPDSRARWEAIWSRREAIVAIVHSHPVGPLAFSTEDESTMAALLSGLGRPLIFSVVAPDGILRRIGNNDEIQPTPEPWWAALLRLASGMTKHMSPSAAKCEGPQPEPPQRRAAPESSRALVGVGVSGAKPLTMNKKEENQ